MTQLQEQLFTLRDQKYARFQAKLVPGVPEESIIGIRVPILRRFAKEYGKDPDRDEFLQQLPHRYYEENLLHMLLLAQFKDFQACLAQTERFLPYIDNWAVCDCAPPKVFSRHRQELIKQVEKWVQSDACYTCRYGVGMLMRLYLDEDFREEYLRMVAAVRSEEYYVKMGVAWYFATALAKQWNSCIPYLEHHQLDLWTHNKTIQKAVESYRITEEQKDYLRTLKRREVKNGKKSHIAAAAGDSSEEGTVTGTGSC